MRPAQGSVTLLSLAPEAADQASDAAPDPAAAADPGDWFNRGIELEARSKAEAEAAYRQAIGKAPDYIDAYLNLGVMLCDAGRCQDAVELYRKGLQHCPDEARLHFNLAVALEDLQRPQDALACYESCLRLAPTFADAHYNAARLHESMGQPRKAIRHYSEYRRLERQP